MNYMELINKAIILCISLIAGIITYFVVYECVGIVLNAILLLIGGRIFEAVNWN